MNKDMRYQIEKVSVDRGLIYSDLYPHYDKWQIAWNNFKGIKEK